MSAARLIKASLALQNTRLLDNVTITIEPGELVALVGPNGAGKSTALKAMLGLIALDQGQAELDDRAISSLPPRLRGRLASYLPQDRPLAWRLYVEDVVALGLFAWNGRSYRRLDPDHQTQVQEILTRVDALHLLGRDMATLSGGERARIHLARTLISPAPLLVADEPATALDLRHQHLTMQALRQEADQGRAVLTALHDLDAAQRWAHRIIILDQGRVIADEPAQTALTEERLEQVFGVKREPDGAYVPA